MSQPSSFKWRHFEAESILLCIRWYLRYPAPLPRSRRTAVGARDRRQSHHDLSVGATLRPRIGAALPTASESHEDSCRVDETYVKVKGIWMYLYRAVDSAGHRLEFRLSSTRDAETAKPFFHKMLEAAHTVTPRVITVDKHAAYPKALANLKSAGAVPDSCELRQVKYLNNLIEQDHRLLKRLVKPGLGFWSFGTAWRTLQGYEVRHMIRKGQANGVEKGANACQTRFIAGLFGVAA